MTHLLTAARPTVFAGVVKLLVLAVPITTLAYLDVAILDLVGAIEDERVSAGSAYFAMALIPTLALAGVVGVIWARWHAPPKTLRWASRPAVQHAVERTVLLFLVMVIVGAAALSRLPEVVSLPSGLVSMGPALFATGLVVIGQAVEGLDALARRWAGLSRPVQSPCPFGHCSERPLVGGSRATEAGVRRVPIIKLAFKVKDTPVFAFVPKSGPKDIGDRLFFADRLNVTRIGDKTVGGDDGLAAGTHSGFLTALRFLEVADPYLPGAELVWQQQATYKLNAVDGNLPLGLKEGQITAQGLVLVRNHEPLEPVTFAITGGTDAYANARGQVTETNKGKLKTLEIEV